MDSLAIFPIDWNKVFGSAIAAVLLRWAAIPEAVWPLVFLMFADLILGVALALANGLYSNRILGIGIIRKLAAFFMLGATAAVTQHALPLTEEWGAILYFVRAMTIYEFLSCADTYRQLRGPGSPWITRFAEATQEYFESRFRKTPPPEPKVKLH
jgi:hypothetical protein